MNRRKLETIAVFTPVVIFGGFIAYSFTTARLAVSSRENAALAAGFTSADERDWAVKAGFPEAAAWNSKKKADAEQTAYEELHRKKDWEAKAPERAAAAVKQAAQRAADEAAAAEVKRPPGERLTISAQSWKTGGFDTIGLMTFTLGNDNPYPVKDFEISCAFYGNSGTLLGTRTKTIYEIVKPKSKRTFKDISVGFIPSQSARGGCSVESALRS